MAAVMDGLLEKAQELARVAGQYQRSRLWTPLNIEYKGEVDLVTEPWWWMARSPTIQERGQ